MKFRNNDILLYIAMGDAYAAAVEYLKRGSADNDRIYLESMKFERYLAHPTHRHAAGFYTDDAEMSVANARALISIDFRHLDPFCFAYYWLAEFVRGGKRKGYARGGPRGGFQKFLEVCVADVGGEVSRSCAHKFLDNIRPHSKKNGACMRAVPFGALANVHDGMRLADLQGRITHDTAEGRFSAQAVAAMAHYAMYSDKPMHDVGRYCKKILPRDMVERWGYVFDSVWPSGTAVTSRKKRSVAITTVHATCSHLRQYDSLKRIMMAIIQDGGDTDSVAAIAWGIASCRMQDEVLPDFLEHCLEGGNPKTGAVYLKDLGTQLMDRFSS